jgi:RHS repeat-associated protein
MRKALRFVCFCVLLLFASLYITAQNPVPASAPYDDHGAYAINLADLSIVLKTPFRSKDGLTGFNATGTVSANHFLPDSNYIHLLASYTLTPNVNVKMLGMSASAVPYTSTCPDGVTQTNVYQAWEISEGNGDKLFATPAPGANTFVDLENDGVTSCWHTTASYVTVDGSGLTILVNTSPKSVVIYSSSGEKVVSTTGSWSPFNTYYDANGNTISLNASTGKYTDTLATIALTQTLGATSDYTWTDVNGGTQRTEITTTPLYGATRFGCGSLINSTDTTTSNYLTGISYASGTSLGIAYEQTAGLGTSYTTGRVKSITLPTGGSVTFAYSGTFNCVYYLSPMLTVTTSEGSWVYSWAKGGGINNPSTVTTVTNPHGDVTTYTVVPSTATPPLTPIPLLYQITSTASTITFCYNTSAMCSVTSTNNVNAPITRTDTYTQLAGMTTSSRVTKTFDSMGNVLTVSSYAFGASSPSFTTTTTYGTWNGTGCSNIGNHIIDKPCDVITTDAAGHILKESRVAYDSKGNALTSYVGNGTTFLSASATYNSNGTTKTATDIAGATTSYTYGACNSAFLTQKTLGPLTSYSAWDCVGGVKTSDTDVNGNVTTYGYKDSSGVADPLWRLNSLKDQSTNTTWTIYGSSTIEKKFSFGSSVEDAITTIDGFGRVSRVQTKLGSGYSTVTTAYNPAANTKSVSVPCSASLGADCTAGFTTTTLDSGARVSSIVDGGGSTITNVYTQNDVTRTSSPHPTGESNKVVQTETDGLGRTVSVCQLMTSGGSACGQVAGGSGILTTLSYSTAVGSTTVTQTRGAETKTAVKDYLGRITSTTTPEEGTITYYWDLSPDCSGAMSGLLSEKKDNGGFITCYYHDALSRLQTIEAHNSTPKVCEVFVYDSLAFPALTPPAGFSLTSANPVGHVIEAYTNNCAGGAAITDEWFAYDYKGQATDVWEMTPHSGGYYHTTSTYAANGALGTLAGIPGYSTTTYGLDADGHLSTAVEGTTTIVAGVTYGPLGATVVNVGAGTDEDNYTYDANTGRMTKYQFFVGSANTKGVLTWNTNGSLASLAITDGFNAGGTHTCTFGYDDVARLVSDSCGSVWSQTFTYDQYDNLTKAGSSSWNPGYNTNNQYSTIGATYDARGNVTYDGVQRYTWNGFGKMASSSGNPPVCGSTGVCYTYDALGRMVERVAGNAYQEVLYSPVGKTALMNGTGVTYSYQPLPGGGTLYSTGTSGSNRLYQHKDWLNSARVMSTVVAGTVTYDRAFAPYGEVYANFGGTQPANFTGDTPEFATWLLDTSARELNGGQGRWESPDPTGMGWNLYAYGTDPNTQTDLTGLSTWMGNPYGSLGSISGYGSDAGFYFGLVPVQQDIDKVQQENQQWMKQEAQQGVYQQPGSCSNFDCTPTVAPFSNSATITGPFMMNLALSFLENMFDMRAGCNEHCSETGGVVQAADPIANLPFVVGGLGDLFIIKTTVMEDGGLVDFGSRVPPEVAEPSPAEVAAPSSAAAPSPYAGGGLLPDSFWGKGSAPSSYVYRMPVQPGGTVRLYRGGSLLGSGVGRGTNLTSSYGFASNYGSVYTYAIPYQELEGFYRGGVNFEGQMADQIMMSPEQADAFSKYLLQ